MSECVTWLIPVKNGMPYLPETLASIEAQTYENWEVLIWDNGSTDGTLEELEKWVPERLPGRVVTNDPCGVGGSLAKMVEASNTELCARIDADDINVPQRLETQLSYLIAHPDVAVVGSSMYLIHQDTGFNELYPRPTHPEDIVNYLISVNSMAHPSVMFRRSAILEVGNYRERPGVEDYDLWLRVATKYKLANLELPLIYYRIRSNSETATYIGQGTLKALTDDCFVQNAPLLFGCTEDEARLLRENRHPIAALALCKTAFYLHKTQGGGIFDRLRSASFIGAGTMRLSPSDWGSRIAIALLSSLSINRVKHNIKQWIKARLHPEQFVFLSALRHFLKQQKGY
ncbi:hypothetical protein NIES2135_35320 [Leptolyngbya boryana NIES-2135]|jgi:glycosyltransferase involved in cell wall biosynthesis|uniref:Glycosyltransferase 2-like domain-containing protein n=1 Tax=Leptolyngbya boryana NIES-2135 TaxID=1973484 RepID=A0A1Z4JJ03_LEPBY|nr:MULTISPECIES: glycosyltransferase [Leptolyngbya]BAY56696.1 hypothetical protein NIES2135_35320 [Leptolyngbya boryana NIES-2135]MBD2369467.1 glycosyltransferase [Leptolyngbya sp. FACHB-161]MBD2376788.1 glycosyltransferase [Leptolyngbya sp. FACHB-238]MBD2401155.1 glycosyltransferase [Leptolyngbya sp. FACHB-239]MBD2407706.1 glycosyltransferase [Leptolyngbya sp. FACHB-402]